MTRLSPNFARELLKLLKGGTCYEGAFKGSHAVELLRELYETGSLDYDNVGTQRKKYFCPSGDKLAAYLHHKFNIPSLEIYVDSLQKKDIQRSEAVKAASNSKIRKTKVLKGFLVNCHNEIEGVLNGQPIQLKPTPGSFIFINDPDSFVIPQDVTVVVVENYENFRYIERQNHLFMDPKLLFIWRYQNSKIIVRWLNQLPNKYMHFGDFDPKGLHIYVAEFRRKLTPDRCSFFIPPNLEELITNHGNTDLYEKQIIYLKNFDFDNYVEIKTVATLLSRLRKGVEQEVLIKPA